MKITRYTGDPGILKRTELKTEDFDAVVKEIIENVKAKGDEALTYYTDKFDHVHVEQFRVPEEEFAEAITAVGPGFVEILRKAADRIERFHKSQKRQSQIINEANGTMLGTLIIPLSRVGVYVPGGKALYPSSVLMNIMPAKVAGVEEIIMITPPQRDGKVDPRVLAAAEVCGVKSVYKVGGAQAIAALAYGTEQVPRVDKIVGPGNIFVATAKKLVYGQVSVDSIAGPSEILILADDSADPVLMAADMLSQAEHDEMAGSILITDSEQLANDVALALDEQTAQAPRRAVIEASLANRGMILLVRDLKEGVDMANAYAPEHMEIVTRDPFNYVPLIKNAGAIFVGPNSPEPLGDYMAGPNHVLPTGGSARFFSPLGVDDFIKRSSLLYISEGGLKELGEDVITFAEEEKLYAHANAIRLRLKGQGL